MMPVGDAMESVGLGAAAGRVHSAGLDIGGVEWWLVRGH